MVGEFGSHSRGLVLEGRMDTAEVVNTAKQKDSTRDGLLSASQAMRAPNQRSQISPEGTVEALDKGRVDRAVELGGSPQAGEHGTRAAQDIAGDAKGAVGLVFDDLSQGQARPDTVDRAVPQASSFVGERALEGVTVGRQAVKGDVQRHFLRPTPHQCQIADENQPRDRGEIQPGCCIQSQPDKQPSERKRQQPPPSFLELIVTITHS